MPRWEYMRLTLPPVPYAMPGAPPEAPMRTAQAMLDEWGAEGWEAVCMLEPYVLLLKRPWEEPQT